LHRHGDATPPVGMNVFVAAGLAKAKASDVINVHLWTYMLCSFVMMVLLMVFPQIILYLPHLGK
jgi:C4-dicarboxylate transporter DctM subunit